MLDPNAHPPGQDFTGRWRLNYGDYNRAIALHAHYANKAPDAIEAVLVDSANQGRTLQLFAALLDFAAVTMPTLGDPDTVRRMQELAALWSGKHNDDIPDA